MSKLAALVAIPLGVLALKRLQELLPDDPNPTPLISPTPTKTPFYQDLIFRDIEKDISPTPTETPVYTDLIIRDKEKKSCAYGYHLENGICVKSKGIGF